MVRRNQSANPVPRPISFNQLSLLRSWCGTRTILMAEKWWEQVASLSLGIKPKKKPPHQQPVSSFVPPGEASWTRRPFWFRRCAHSPNSFVSHLHAILVAIIYSQCSSNCFFCFVFFLTILRAFSSVGSFWSVLVPFCLFCLFLSLREYTRRKNKKKRWEMRKQSKTR